MDKNIKKPDDSWQKQIIKTLKKEGEVIEIMTFVTYLILALIGVFHIIFY